MNTGYTDGKTQKNTAKHYNVYEKTAAVSVGNFKACVNWARVRTASRVQSFAQTISLQLQQLLLETAKVKQKTEQTKQIKRTAWLSWMKRVVVGFTQQTASFESACATPVGLSSNTCNNTNSCVYMTMLFTNQTWWTISWLWWWL